MHYLDVRKKRSQNEFEDELLMPGHYIKGTIMHQRTNDYKPRKEKRSQWKRKSFVIAGKSSPSHGSFLSFSWLFRRGHYSSDYQTINESFVNSLQPSLPFTLDVSFSFFVQWREGKGGSWRLFWLLSTKSCAQQTSRDDTGSLTFSLFQRLVPTRETRPWGRLGLLEE